jgi:hypothetical protein
MCVRFTRSSRPITGRLHDELVMMDPVQGKYFSLNPVATRIWDLLEKPLDMDGICRVLMEEFEVDESRCRDEVSEHVDEMVRMGLIDRLL